MPTATFLPGYRKAVVPSGTTILDAARAAGLPMNVVCGGQGKCGKCLVFIKDGTVSFDIEDCRRFFSNNEIASGACLACTWVRPGAMSTSPTNMSLWTGCRGYQPCTR